VHLQYPVINTHFATREDGEQADPTIITETTNRNLLQPTSNNKKRRKSRIQDIREEVHQGDKQRSSSSSKQKSSLPLVGKLLHRQPSSSSTGSGESQLVDLVVEDVQAEQIERVRARKEGGPGWNESEQKHYV